MILPLFLLLAGALQQQPTAAPGLPSHPSASPVTPIDSTVRAISDIAVKIAEMRSVYELYRRAAFNEPDGALLQRADMYATSCRDLAAVIQRSRPVICRACLARRVQADIDQYKAYLPAVERLGAACASRMEQLKTRGTAAAQTRALRAEVAAQGSRMTAALRTYEEKLYKVRVAMNWTTPVTRRGG